MSAGNVAIVATSNTNNFAVAFEDLVPSESQFWKADAVTFAKQVFAELGVLRAQNRLTDRIITLIHDFQTNAAKCTKFEHEITKTKAIFEQLKKKQSELNPLANEVFTKYQNLGKQIDEIRTVAMEIKVIKSNISDKEGDMRFFEQLLDSALKRLAELDKIANFPWYAGLKRSGEVQVLSCNSNIEGLKLEVAELTRNLKKKEAEQSSPQEKEKQKKLNAMKYELDNHQRFLELYESNQQKLSAHEISLFTNVCQMRMEVSKNQSNLEKLKLEIDKQKAAIDFFRSCR